MCLSKFLSNIPLGQQVRHLSNFNVCAGKLRHLICFKQWTPEMVSNVICSAIRLKRVCANMHGNHLNTLKGMKVMILQEINEPILNMAVSKAATFLGAEDVNITDKMVWEHDYNGRIFSLMSDIIFVCTATHMCVQRFADMASVPVMCMKSRTHASIQSLSTIMTIVEHCGRMDCLNVAYLGAPHPVLNSYLLLCPMLGANIRFKCCCDKCPVSPLLIKASEDMSLQSNTESKQCDTKDEVLRGANVIIAGPTTTKKDKIPHFTFTVEDILRNTGHDCWKFFHTCPRGLEVPDTLFNHYNSYTYCAFENMLYISASLMAYGVKEHLF